LLHFEFMAENPESLIIHPANLSLFSLFQPFRI
jgi:hypothetical protein